MHFYALNVKKIQYIVLIRPNCKMVECKREMVYGGDDRVVRHKKTSPHHYYVGRSQTIVILL